MMTIWAEYKEYVQERRDAGYEDGEQDFVTWMMGREQLDVSEQAEFAKQFARAPHPEQPRLEWRDNFLHYNGRCIGFTFKNGDGGGYCFLSNQSVICTSEAEARQALWDAATSWLSPTNSKEGRMMRQIPVLIRCPPCRGKGRVANINIPMAIITLGVSALVDTALGGPCTFCRGRGRVCLSRG